MMMWLIVGSVVWVLTGVFAVAMDYTLEFDLTTCDLFPVIMFGSLLGPFALLFWLLARPSSCKRKVLIRRRKL